MTVAIVAVQGAFIEHEHMLAKLGADCLELREKSDLDRHYDALILPGGESTVQGKLLKELDMFDTLLAQIKDGMPVLATCAGLILLARETVNDERTCLRTLPVAVRRNAYGRQLGSFYTEAEMKGIGIVPMTFIRAPYIDHVEEGVEVLACVDDRIVAVRYQNQLAMAFHPELGADTRIHQAFLDMIPA